MEQAIRAVLIVQQWDKSVREHLTPKESDWTCIKEMAIFFNIFRKPTIASQAKFYPTLHNTIPDYLHIIRQLNVHQIQAERPILRVAATAAHEKMEEYLKKAMLTRNAFVALICDPRYKLSGLEYLFGADGGTLATQYKVWRGHFETIYSRYKQRASKLAEMER